MEQKIILVTGASSGIGKACAEQLINDGHIVYGTSRKAMNPGENNLFFLQCDVTDKASVDQCVSRIIAEQGRLDVVMNNAGAGIVGALELTTQEEFDFQMEVNFRGVFNVCTAVVPIFREQRSGTIINVSSVGGVMGLPFQGLYSASKFAVEGFSEALRLELHPFKINVVLIQPGDFNTGFTGHRMVSKATQEHPDYKGQFATTLKLIEDNENNGCHPQLIARLVSKIVKSKKPAFRQPIGNIVERLSIFVKRLVPGRFFQWILRVYYKVD